MTLPYDELNTILTRLQTEAAETSPNGERRYDPKKCCDIVLDYLIYCYVMGVDNVNEMLSTSIAVNSEEMREVIYKRIEGKNFEERVREYAERTERTERPPVRPENRPQGGERTAVEERPTQPQETPFQPSPVTPSPTAPTTPTTPVSPTPTAPRPTPSPVDMPSGERRPDIPEDLYDIFRVADTEGHRTFSESEYLTAKKGGARYKTWITMEDDRVRSTHEFIDRIQVGIDDYFVTWDGDKALYPGNFSKPENVINCRCQCLYT